TCFGCTRKSFATSSVVSRGPAAGVTLLIARGMLSYPHVTDCNPWWLPAANSSPHPPGRRGGHARDRAGAAAARGGGGGGCESEARLRGDRRPLPGTPPRRRGEGDLRLLRQ